MVDFHVGEHPVALEHPVDLLLLTPHHVPIIVISFPPLPSRQGFVHAVLEVGLELDIDRLVGIMLLFYIFAKVL